MPPDPSVLFQWGVSSYFGWGVYGLNLMLAWADHPVLRPASLQAIDPAALDLDPLERRVLAPALARSATVLDGLRQLAGRNATSRHLVLHTINNGMTRGRAAHDVDLWGTPTVGVAFVDRATAAPGAAAALRPYGLVVAGSSWNRRVLEEAGAGRVELLLQGVDPSRFHPAPRRGLFPGRFVVFSGGKLELRKGQDLVLAGFARFARRHPEALLLTAWSSPWPEAARSLAGSPHAPAPPLRGDGTVDVVAWAGLAGIAAGQILDLGPVPNRQMPPILREADAGLFASRAEGGTNLVAMECMACGVPTILSANTGHLDLLVDGAALPLTHQRPVPGDEHRDWGESSPDEIAAGLEALFADRDRARATGERGAASMAGLSWRGQFRTLAGLLTPLLG